ncbi:glycosyltransferase family 2 protein [Coprococcus catus]
MSPKVSVIVPAYNAEHMLAACLDALLLQTYVNKEIVVVDDGSTDNTADICDQYQANNECIKIVHQRNAGVSAARNTALDYSSGEYIVFVDSDDTVDPQYIEELMAWSEYDFVTAGYYWQKPDLSWDTRRFEDIGVSKCDLKAYPSKYMGKYYFGSPWATLMKKKIIDSAKLKFDEEIRCGEDILFIFQYLEYANTIKILPVCGYWYHYYPNSLVNTRHSDFWKWKIRVESEIFNYFHPYNKEEQIALLNRIFDVLRDLLRDYSTQMSNQELFAMYQHPFFEESIAYKKSSGSFKEHILIFAMQCKNYKIYVLADKIHYFFKRITNKLKRMLSEYAR